MLIVMAVILITGFQFYWLKQNYSSQRFNLEATAGIHFRESIYSLQGLQFRKRFNNTDSNIDVSMVKAGSGGKAFHFENNDAMVGMVNVMREQIDTMDGHHMETIVIKSDKKPKDFTVDSFAINSITVTKDQVKGNRFIQLLTGIDSLRDSLKIKDIVKATEKTFAKEGITVPFSVIRLDTVAADNFPLSKNAVTIGFAKPISYKLVLGNTMPYLLKKISWPILFSLFLVAITMVSFLLMYRSLMQQQRLAALKNDFISNVTHELKTPIATVNVALEALKSFNALNDPQRTKEYLDISQQELQRLSLLVDKVLRVSMFENRNVALKPEHFNLLTLVNEVCSSMRLQFEKLQAVVHIDSSGEDLEIYADRLHIMSVIYNLLDNALKYSKGQPVINIAIKEAGDSVEMQFSDQGIGIPEAYQSKVFDKFFRVPQGDVHDVKGYGLGLSYVYHIIKQHEGSIALQSEPGKGTNFSINLPKGNG